MAHFSNKKKKKRDRLRSLATAVVKLLPQFGVQRSFDDLHIPSFFLHINGVFSPPTDLMTVLS